MKTFKTSLGKTISASTSEDAQRIAADYDMGEIVSEVEIQPKPAFGIRDGKFIAWDRKTKSAENVGTLAEAVEAHQQNTSLSVMYYGLGKPSTLNNHERSMMNKLLKSH